jgi:hypothetical protein
LHVFRLAPQPFPGFGRSRERQFTREATRTPYAVINLFGGDTGMRGALGGLMIAVGFAAVMGLWIYTTYYFFVTGQIFFALLSLLVPPADLVLPFLIAPVLGFVGIGGTVLAFAGFAVKGD